MYMHILISNASIHTGRLLTHLDENPRYYQPESEPP